jgi:hypothetical protein
MVVTVGCIINPEGSFALAVAVAESQALGEGGYNAAGSLLPEGGVLIRRGLDTAVDGEAAAARSASEDALLVVRWASWCSRGSLGGSAGSRLGGGSSAGDCLQGGAGNPVAPGWVNDRGGGRLRWINLLRGGCSGGPVNPWVDSGRSSLGGVDLLCGCSSAGPVGPGTSRVRNPETDSSVGHCNGGANGRVNGDPVTPNRGCDSGVNRLDGGADPVVPDVGGGRGCLRWVNLLCGGCGALPVNPWVDSGRSSLGGIDLLCGGGGAGPVDPGVNSGGAGLHGINWLGGGCRAGPVEPWSIGGGRVDRLGGCGGGRFPGQGRGGQKGGGQNGRGRFDHHDW